MVYAVVQVFCDCNAKRIAIQESDWTAGGTQPGPQFLSQGGLAGAR